MRPLTLPASPFLLMFQSSEEGQIAGTPRLRTTLTRRSLVWLPRDVAAQQQSPTKRWIA